MKLLLSSFLLTLHSASFADAFVPGSLAQTRTTHQELMWFWSKDPVETEAPESGFTHDLLSDEDDAEEEKKVRMKFFNKPKVSAVDIDNLAEEEDDDDNYVDLTANIRNLPTKEMTGVEPEIARLCSTISHQLYSKKSKDEFALCTKDMKTEVLLYDRHGVFSETTSPFGVFVTGKTMIIGWRGTNTLVDGINDIAISAQSSIGWRKHAKTIKAQGAFTSIIYNDIVLHEEAIIKKAKELGITEIITTGQSLGAACGQLGHLVIRAQMQDETSPWFELKGINVRSVVFCAPMSTVLLDNATPETDAFVKELSDNSCNFVYKNDVVPRAYGYLSFIQDFVEDSIDDVVALGYSKSPIPVPRLLKYTLGFQKKLENLVAGAKGDEKLVGILQVLSKYRHLGNLVYYKDEDAVPVVLTDMGAFHKNTAGAKNLFRSQKYTSVKKPLDDFLGWHMDIIGNNSTGLCGLSYSTNELSKE
jgi:hypothetical protein